MFDSTGSYGDGTGSYGDGTGYTVVTSGAVAPEPQVSAQEREAYFAQRRLRLMTITGEEVVA